MKRNKRVGENLGGPWYCALSLCLCFSPLFRAGNAWNSPDGMPAGKENEKLELGQARVLKISMTCWSLGYRENFLVHFRLGASLTNLPSSSIINYNFKMKD